MADSDRKTDSVTALQSSFLTIEEAAAIARAARRTVHRWIAEGRFESVRPIARGSGRRLVDRASFLAFIGAGP